MPEKLNSVQKTVTHANLKMRALLRSKLNELTNNESNRFNREVIDGGSGWTHFVTEEAKTTKRMDSEPYKYCQASIFEVLNSI